MENKVPQPTDLCSSLEATLELAERALSYSNQNVQLTMRMWIQGSPNEQLLAKRAANCSEIALLVQKIQNEIQSEDEKRLLEAATPHSTLIADDGTLFHQPAPGENYVEAENVTANVMLPLLLDNASWKAFVELLRARLKIADLTDEASEAMTFRARELVRQNQVLKSIVAERKRLEERLSQLASIIECANEAIAIFTMGGTIVSWNRGAEAVYGYSAREVLGRSRYILISPDDPDPIPELLERLERQEVIPISDGVHLRKGGQHIHVSFTISPVKDADGSTVGFSAFIRPSPPNAANPHNPKHAVPSSSNNDLAPSEKTPAPHRYNFGASRKS
jgi:PAS domain S-box-containing protein